MIALFGQPMLLVAHRFQRLLVIVPTDPLRWQVARKFVTLGILKSFGVIGQSASYPVVGIMTKRPKLDADIDTFFSSCNVVITTMSLLAGLEKKQQESIASHCSHLFIDEAHHVAAPKWEEHKPIIQFTATPFRNDGKPVDGQIIYNYPLRKAQDEGYFKKIQFIPVVCFSETKADIEIAKRAVAQLRLDITKGYQHIMMFRASTIARAEALFKLYVRRYSKYNPVLIHSQLKASERKQRLSALQEGNSRIVVCVDMLGEGFDLPTLKIAALHDIHKSLGVTLQFVGRFTRTATNIGEASIIANIADPAVNASLKTLYSEDADWNILLRQISKSRIQKELEFSNIVSHFNQGALGKIQIKNILPKMSCVVYRAATEEWQPDEYRRAFGKRDEILHLLNPEDKILVIIRRNSDPVSWGTFKDILDMTHDLYVVYWQPEKKLLFINSTANGLHGELAAMLVESPTIISEDAVFRCFHGVNRLILHNVGLRDALRGPVRYRMFAGLDVGEGLSDAQLRNRIKSNLFGVGFENGEKTSIGCSYKGRVWAKKITNLAEWRDWCKGVGNKLTNEQLSVDEILKGVLKPKRIDSRPRCRPFSIEWPEIFFEDYYNSIYLGFGQTDIPFYQSEIELTDNNSNDGPIRFRIFGDGQASEYELIFQSGVSGKNYSYRLVSGPEVQITIGKRKKTLREWFDEEPPIIWFVDGSHIANDIFVSLPAASFSEEALSRQREKIVSWDWTGTDIKKESQKLEKRADSIQRRVIEELLQDQTIEIIFDDDSAGEAADIITIKTIRATQTIRVDFYHCKFSKEETPGGRVEDLYAVCGQAQKCVHWKIGLDRLVDHMKKREARMQDKGVSRFERGDLKKLIEFKNMAQFYAYDLYVTIVQPGLSKQDASQGQLELLCATEAYMRETYNIPLTVVGSC